MKTANKRHLITEALALKLGYKVIAYDAMMLAALRCIGWG